LDGLRLGSTFRGGAGLPVEVEVDLQGNLTVEQIGDLGPYVVSAVAPLGLNFLEHCQPERWAAGIGWEQKDRFSIHADGFFTRWDKMELNVATVVDSTISTQLIELTDQPVSDANDMNVELRSTWSGRLGGEYRFPSWTPKARDNRDWDDEFGSLVLAVRSGVGLEPTPLVRQGTSTTLLDADRMLVAGGLGLSHGDPFGVVEGPVQWDIFMAYQFLATGSLDLGTVPQYRAGAPAGGEDIPIGGHLWAAGLQWSFHY
jgi:hypothetical protein